MRTGPAEHEGQSYNADGKVLDTGGEDSDTCCCFWVRVSVSARCADPCVMMDSTYGVHWNHCSACLAEVQAYDSVSFGELHDSLGERYLPEWSDSRRTGGTEGGRDAPGSPEIESQTSQVTFWERASPCSEPESRPSPSDAGEARGDGPEPGPSSHSPGQLNDGRALVSLSGLRTVRPPSPPRGPEPSPSA